MEANLASLIAKSQQKKSREVNHHPNASIKRADHTAVLLQQHLTAFKNAQALTKRDSSSTKKRTSSNKEKKSSSKKSKKE